MRDWFVDRLLSGFASIIVAVNVRFSFVSGSVAVSSVQQVLSCSQYKSVSDCIVGAVLSTIVRLIVLLSLSPAASVTVRLMWCSPTSLLVGVNVIIPVVLLIEKSVVLSV